MFAEERLSAAFKRWDHTRTLLHQKRRRLAAASKDLAPAEGPDRAILSIEVKCIDELCDQLFAQLMAIANEIESARDFWAPFVASDAHLGRSTC